MQLIVCKDQDEGARRAHAWLSEALACQQPGALVRLFVPAGETPRSLYRLWRDRSPVELSRLTFVQVDDVASGPRQNLFKAFLQEELAPWLGQIEFISAAQEGADLGILGLGLNGHLAFHEPSLPWRFFSGCVRLEAQTCERLNVSLDTWGVTYGLSAFLQCQALLLLVFGESKRDILRRALQGDCTLPATALMRHPDLTIIADESALPRSESSGV